MADRKRENSGAKNSRRNKADPGYGAQIREAERILNVVYVFVYAASGKEGAGAAYSNMKELDYSDKYMQERRAVASRYANLDNFENPEVSKFLTSKQKAEFYRKRAAVKRTRAVAGAVGAAAGAVTGAGMGMFLGISVQRCLGSSAE